MTQSLVTLLPFSFSEQWESVPSTKMRGRQLSWAPCYSAFSQESANAVLSLLLESKGQIVFDPFMGSGTSAAQSP